jgi:hypothetical protein
MKKRLPTIIPVAIFLVITGVLIFDITMTHSEISRNSEIINDIEKNLNDIKSDIAETRLRIERYRKDPKAAEAILRKKFEMIRKDQYYIND